MIRPYLVRNAYSAQIEAWSLIGIRIGYTCFGLAAWPPKTKKLPWWVPGFRLVLWSHTGQCDQRWVFKVCLRRRYLGFKTRGDATPDLARYHEAGFRWR